MSITLADAVINLLADDSKLNSSLDGVEKKTSRWSSGLGGMMKNAFSFAIGGLIETGIRGIADSLGGIVTGAMEAQEIQAQLNAVLTSTGGISGVTADMANALADSLETVTKFSGEAVLGGENMLLTFTNIGKDVFPAATETMLDMSQALGQDLKSSAIQLGKALNDPIAGVSALSRVGVTFTEAQKDQIKVMVESGDVMGAQKVILAELNREFGGAAKAAGETYAGKLAILDNMFGRLKDTVGNAVLPILTDLAGNLIGLAKDALPSVEAAAGWLDETFGLLMDNLTDNRGAVYTLMSGLGSLLTSFVNLIPGMEEVQVDLVGLAKTATDTWNWITVTGIPVLDQWKQTAIDAGTTGFNWLQTNALTPMWNKAQEAWVWIQLQGIPVLQQWGQSALDAGKTGFGVYLDYYLIPMWNKAVAIWDWIKATAIPILLQWGTTFKEGLDPHIQKVSDRLQAFYEKIQPPLQAAWESLQRLWNSITEYYELHLGPALTKLAAALGLNTTKTDASGKSFGDFVGKLIEIGLELLLDAITGAIVALTIATNILAAGIETVTDVISIFKAIWDGIASKINAVKTAFKNFKDELVDFVLPDWLQPGSPTPFENGLRGIADAAAEAAKVMRGLLVPSFAGLPGGAGAVNGTPGSSLIQPGAGASVSSRSTVNNIYFYGGTGAPTNASQANDAAFLLVNALAARGVAL